MLKVVSIGGFGHSNIVFDDMMGMEEAQLVGLSPAYEGEDITLFASHELCKNVKIYSDYSKMIQDVKPDVAIISTRLDIIPDVIVAAANAGCHIIAEKPLALDNETLGKVQRAIEGNNVKLTAMLSMRSEEQFIAARDFYMSGKIGQAVLVNARKSYKYGTRPEWFADKDKYGGTIGWIGIHAFDFVNFVTGLGFKKVSAMQGNFNHPDRAACQDNCVIISELSNGGHMTVSIDLFRPETAGTWGDDWIRVVGTKGIIEARGSDRTCIVLVDGKEHQSVELPEKRAVFRDFLLSLTGQASMKTYQQESFMLTDVCLSAEESSLSGKIEDLK